MTPQQIFDKAIPEPNSGCWLWTGSVDKDGYGVVKRPWALAHRVSFEAHCAQIPDGVNVLHSCDQPCCVNPAHLRLGTHKDNSDDRVKRGRAAGPKGIAHGSAKLTDETVRAIRRDERSTRLVADAYGIHQAQVSRIRRRINWGHVQ